MNLADLTYVRLETGTGMMLEPDYFVLDLHFLAFPSTVEPSLYQSMGSVVFRCAARAHKAAASLRIL